MASVGWATLDVIPSFKGLQGQLDRGTAGPLKSSGAKSGALFGDEAGRSAGKRFGGIFSATAGKAIAALGAAGIGAAAFKLTKDSIGLASDLEESTNKVSQVFGSAAGSVLKFTEGTADALGQTNSEAREAAATFGIFGNAAGLADRKNAKFAKRMTTLASDLASFNNTEPDQAVQALGAALRGESEPIRAYGVMLDEATLKAEALALGILKPVKDQSKIFSYQTRITDLQAKYNEAVKENGKESLEALKAEASLGTARTALQKATEGTLPPLTQQQKLLAAQSQIFKQTEVAQGDFARTSDGLANQQRRLAARFEDAKARLGEGLLPIMTDAADFLLDEGIPAFERFADWFNEDGIPALQEFGGFVEDASGKVGDLISFVKDLPKPAQFAGLAALIGGAGALKLRGGSGGALGTAGKALGLAKPVPVFVTNKGFGTDDLGGRRGGPGGFFATAGKWLTRFGRAGGAGAAIAGGGFYMDRGIVDHKGDPAKVATAEQNRAFLEKIQKEKAGVEGLISKVDVFKNSLDIVGATRIHPEMAVPGLREAREGVADFIAQKVEASKPFGPYVQINGYERAMQQIATLQNAASAVPTAGVDNGATFQHGGGASITPRAGINIEKLEAHGANLDEILRDGQRRLQRRGLGGRP